MTFGAVAAWQGWLLLAAVVGLAAWLFLLKLRPPRVLIPSLLLWRRVLDDAREQTLWERIRRAVSLALTILIALALALAAVRPGWRAGSGAQPAGRLLVILDASWSMDAKTAGGETRWQRAVAEARRLFAAASGSEMALATTADGIVEGPTTDLALIETALDRVRPGGSDPTAWPRLAGASAVHFLTDGATARSVDASAIVHTVFEAASNVGVTALDVRPSLTAGNAGDAYLEVGNFAAAGQKVRVRVTRGTITALDREFEMRPSELLRQVIPIPIGGDPALEVTVDAPQNALEADDHAYAWVERSQPVAVTVVGAQTQWLRAAFERDPGVRATFVDPATFTVREPAAAGVVIFDRWAPSEPPARPALLFAPPASTPWLSAAAAGSGQPAVRAADEERKPRWETPGVHPVVQGVDPFTLTLERARAYPAASLVPVAESTRGTPLVYVDEGPGARRVIVTFGVDESNLTAAPGFPVLLGNAVEWLARPNFFANIDSGAHQPSRPGLITFAGRVEEVSASNGEPVPLSRVGNSAFARLKRPGLYTAEGDAARSTFAINLADPQLSNLTRTNPFASGRARAVSAGGSAWAWWVYCALAAFALAVAEWWTWQRRITV